MEERLIQNLKALKSIQPDEAFVRHSRQIILTTPQFKPKLGLGIFIKSFKLGATLAIASFLLFIFLGGAAFLKNISSPILSKINNEDKIKNLDMQIKIGEITYRLDSGKELGAQIEEIIDSISL